MSENKAFSFHCPLYVDSWELQGSEVAVVLPRGARDTVGSSGTLALRFHEGSSGCSVPAAPIRIITKSSSLGLTTDPRSCILLTTSGVPVLLWSPGSHSFQVSPFWQFSACAVTFLSAYSLKTDVLQDHLLVCLCIDLSIIYLLPESSPEIPTTG